MLNLYFIFPLQRFAKAFLKVGQLASEAKIWITTEEVKYTLCVQRAFLIRWGSRFKMHYDFNSLKI